MKTLSLLAVVLLCSTLAFGQKVENKPEPFLMVVEDMFHLSGEGFVAAGTVMRGKVKVGEDVELVGIKPTKATSVVRIIKPQVREPQAEAVKGDAVGIVLKGLAIGDLVRGQIVSKPGSLQTTQKFKATFDMLPASEGGRRSPFASGYRPQLAIRLGTFTGTITLPAGTDYVEPGTKGIEAEIELTEPAVLEKGLSFEIKEGGRVVGKGTVVSFEKPKT
jgi:elongation factor Tu